MQEIINSLNCLGYVRKKTIKNTIDLKLFVIIENVSIIYESMKLSRRLPSRVCDRRSFGKWFGFEFILFVGEMAYLRIGSPSEFRRTG